MVTISVISICFNNLQDLKKTCASVDMQTIHPEEHWIINGSTTNEIADWLSITPQPAYRKVLNERDKGISDAFNKGIQKASSVFTHLLHAGDIYASADVLKTVKSVLDTKPEIAWVSGKMKTTRSGVLVEVGKPFENGKLYRGMRSVAHPTWFVKKSLYDKVGSYNANYKIAMDYDMMCRITNEPYGFIDKAIMQFDDTGISTKNYIAGLKEGRKIYESYFGFSLKQWIWQWRLKILYYLLQTGIGKILFNFKKAIGKENW